MPQQDICGTMFDVIADECIDYIFSQIGTQKVIVMQMQTPQGTMYSSHPVDADRQVVSFTKSNGKKMILYMKLV